MQLTVVLGATVTATIDGHSAVNGAAFPDGATLALTSNDPTVATVPDSVPLTSGQSTVAVPITVLAVGSTDITATLTATDGSQFTDTATLIVGSPPPPGLTHITLTLTSP